jgi:purine-cytosine permease-like protein
MRLKLVLIAALVAAAAGAGSCIAIILTAFSSLKPISSPGLLVCLTFLLPAAAVLLASIFVYRHRAPAKTSSIPHRDNRDTPESLSFFACFDLKFSATPH